MQVPTRLRPLPFWIRVAALAAGLAGSSVLAAPRPTFHVAPVDDDVASDALYAVDVQGDAVGIANFEANVPSVASRRVGRATVPVGAPDTPRSFTNGVNRSGQVSGTITGVDNQSYAVVWDAAGNRTDIDPTHPGTSCGINEAGQVCGKTNGVAWLWQAGQFTTLDPPAGSDVMPLGINSKGWVTGQLNSCATCAHTFIWHDGTFSDLGFLGKFNRGTAINDRGHVTGYAEVKALDHAIYFDGKTLRDLGAVLGGREATGHGINNDDVIVGSGNLRGDARTFHAFAWKSGQVADLNDLLDASGAGWVLQSAEAINDAGVIVGYGTYHGKPRGFVLTPVRN